MTLRSARSFVLIAGVILLSACTGNGTGSSERGNPVIPGEPNATGGAHQTAWMANDADTLDLLYVSSAKDGSVYVYSYPQGGLQGWLLKRHASGLCSDRDGDVFVPEGNEVLEYAHGSTQPLATLRNALGGTSQFCAVDPSTGNLAVSAGVPGNSGVAIYGNAQGNVKIYNQRDPNDRYGSITYDDRGNLFVEASAGGRDGDVRLLELPRDGARFAAVRLNGTRLGSGSIQWDGKYLAVESSHGGSQPATISRYRVSELQAALVSKTALGGAGAPLQFWIAGGHIVVPNQGPYGTGTSAVTLYEYPTVDRPRRMLEDGRDAQAATVSHARHHKIAVTTYHYDNGRTGWNKRETLLTDQNVNSGSFGLLHTVSVDDQVDTQPLIVPDETTTAGNAPGKHDVAYVATEHNTVYAIDASSGAVLFQQNFGTPVSTPLGCNNNGPNVGIDGTPVIDKKANAMYVVVYTERSGQPVYFIHEFNLSNLTDVVAPVLVAASHKLTNGSTYAFNATYQRQRPALLESNGNIYAAFGSFCDFSASKSRGWLLGWQAGSLTPLAANRLNDTLATSKNNFFLSAIWMSGYGLSADPAGNVYFVTGNSDPSGTSYNSVTNIAESVAKVSPDLTQILSFFTPSDVGSLDQSDNDFGAGGVLLLPKAASRTPLAAAAGKEGTLFLMHQKNLGGYSPSGDHVVDSVNIGGCWCGESYFDAASDSVPRIVASGGNNVTVWKVQKSGASRLLLAASSPGLPGSQDPGFFTAVSSNGKGPGAIIWALARPDSVPGKITLFAFTGEPPSGSTLQTLYQAPAGAWNSSGGNANLVPVVANGKVYVASYEQLDIFGLLGTNAKAGAPLVKAAGVTGGAPHALTGTLVAMNGSYLTFRTRTGKMVRVDDSQAVRRERSVLLTVGKPFSAGGARTTPPEFCARRRSCG
ncbi:MAG TPA: hypothetical protein VFE16_07165 [Candidatus Cybelea sp.]|jgi:hypothetical protein|nr:hypothetical protein [Candidatus Cybelea sp.]